MTDEYGEPFHAVPCSFGNLGKTPNLPARLLLLMLTSVILCVFLVTPKPIPKVTELTRSYLKKNQEIPLDDQTAKKLLTDAALVECGLFEFFEDLSDFEAQSANSGRAGFNSDFALPYNF